MEISLVLNAKVTILKKIELSSIIHFCLDKYIFSLCIF